MAINFNQINELLRQDFTIENSKELANHILLLMGINAPNHIYTQNSLRKITDTTKKSMFADDPQFADFKAAYDITSSHYDVNIKHKQLILPRLFVIKQYSRSNIIWLNKLGINYEDEPLLNGFYPLGLDFVACQNRFLVVISNQDNLRVLELNQGEELNSTQIEILSNWQNLFAEETNKKLLHSKLWDSLNLESVNKKFYIDIIQNFTNLRKHLTDNHLFDNNQAVIFTNRLIGRLLFCYFLIKKGFIPKDYLELDGQNDNEYYHKKLSQLFFAVLNTPIDERIHDDRSTPYLNGGLFERKDTDIDNVSFPNNYFNNLFAIFHKYNWTVDESLSNYEVMAIDPEMLGRIFENLLAEINVDNDGSSESARKAKGAFYTPRIIVDYMCKESLRQYLQTNSPEHSHNIINRLLDDSIGYLTDQKKNWTDDVKPYKEQLITLLDKITVFDPACGSGAFPMGMLQLILHTYERLGDKLKPNHRKIKIIENSIFGADIEPNAIEISRLRAWLSIIVDEDKQEIEPLPNLDFKFVCCNSLIKLETKGQSNLDDNIGTVEKLQELQHKYFRARTYKNKQEIRHKYHDLIEQSRKQDSLFGESKYFTQIKSYHPFDTKNVCEFYDNQFMFGIQDGFDVVIGNPPYVTIMLGKKTKFNTSLSSYYKSNFETFEYKGNTFALFIEMSHKILKLNGVTSYIIPNTLLLADSFSITRKLLLEKTNLLKLLNCKFKIFEDAEIGGSLILMFSRNKVENNYIEAYNFNERFFETDSYEKILQQQYVEASTNKLYLKNNIFNLVNRICADSDRYGSIVKIYQGVITGDNKKYLAKEKTSSQFLPILRGKDIGKFTKEFSDNYVLFDKKLLWSNTDESNFYKEKLISRQTSDTLIFAYDDEQYLTLDSTHVHTLINNLYSLKFLLGILNCKLLKFIYELMVQEQGRVFAQVKTPILKMLPIPRLDKAHQKPFVVLVDRILDAKKISEDTTELEKQIDQLIYKLYDLTPEEIALIESK